MMHGKAMRIGFLALAVSAPAAAAAQTATESETSTNLSLLDWIDSGLAQGAAASPPEPTSTPALGEGPVGQAFGWLFGGETQSASTGAADSPIPQAIRPAAPASGPVATESVEPPRDEPLTLTQQPRPVATVRPQGLLLPVASP